MDAVILDIDGTLLDSSVIDKRLYMSAVGRVFGKLRLRGDWSTYTNVTDSGLLRDILADNDRPYEGKQVEQVQQLFFEKLHRHIETAGPFPERPGACAFVDRLIAAPEKHVAYATGAWAASARMKLASAGFTLAGVPLATADDAFDRPSIMQSALHQIGKECDRVVYYGDGAWDVAAAKSLGWDFVAVGETLGGLAHFHGALG